MALIFFPELNDALEKNFGKEGAKEIIKSLDLALQATNQKVEETLAQIKSTADALITQKKFELKDELSKELATKLDVARLEGEIKVVRQEIQTVRQEIQTVRQEIQTVKIELDRKFTLTFLILLFAIIFVNQNSLEFLARLFGLMK